MTRPLRLAFMGTPDFSVPTLAALIAAGHEMAAVYCQPPRPAGRGMAERPSPVQAFAEAQGIPVRHPISLKGAEAQAEFAASLDQAMAALESIGRVVAETHADLERRLVVPLAQASFRIGNELARQTLSDAPGLSRYLDAVVAAVDLPVGDAVLEVRMNPQDLELLGRSRVTSPSLRLIADPLVPRAGAIASSADKVVDDRFENRIRATQEAVLAAAADLLRETPP